MSVMVAMIAEMELNSNIEFYSDSWYHRGHEWGPERTLGILELLAQHGEGLALATVAERLRHSSQRRAPACWPIWCGWAMCARRVVMATTC